MSQKVIPKIIHFCWFGGGEKSKDVLEYIKTWQQLLPDYKIMEWNEKTYSIENSIPYVKEAYSSKKWAFVSDYVRLYALYNYGGIYLDTDVQILKSFDDLLKNEVFFGFESKDYLCTAVMGACSKHWFVKEFLDSYKERHFIQEDGSWYTKEIAPDVLALAAEKFGLKYDNEIEQQLEERMLILPSRILGAAWKQVTDDTIAVHLSKGSWRKRTWLRNILTKLNFYRKIFKAHK